MMRGELESKAGGSAGAESRYRLLAENATDVISIGDMTGALQYVSPSCRALLGREPEELVGGSPYDFIHPEDVAAVAQLHAEVMDSPTSLTSPPFRFRHKDGSYVWVESTVRSIRDPDSGAVVEIHASTRDVTARLETQRKLERSERLLAHAQRLTRIGSWEWDLRTNKVTWSEGLYEIFGMRPQQFEPSYEHYIERVHDDDRSTVRAMIQEARSTGGSMDYQCRIVLPGGEMRTIEGHGEAVVRGEEAVLMRGTCQDVTERKRAEDELERMHRELELKKNELERSNLELEQFAYDASHDLVEPLRIMSRLAQTFAEEYGDELNGQGQQFIRSILDGTERMRMLISDLLEYSRVSREPLERSWVSAQRALEEAIELLAESIAEKKAGLSWDPLPTIEVHPAQFRQLLQNLLSNALKFAGDAPLRVHISARHDGDGWEFSVSDNGIGMDPEQGKRVFELFRRLQPTDAYAGTGMGLSICKRIVERHGGRIWVVSAEGEGTVFHFTIPEHPTGMETALKRAVS